MQIQRKLNDQDYREKLLSPGRYEYVFGRKNKAEALQTLKQELDELIVNLNEALTTSNRSIMSPFMYNLGAYAK